MHAEKCVHRACKSSLATIPTTDMAKDPAKDIAKDPVKDLAKDPVKDPANDLAKDPAKDPANDLAKDLAKDLPGCCRGAFVRPWATHNPLAATPESSWELLRAPEAPESS